MSNRLGFLLAHTIALFLTDLTYKCMTPNMVYHVLNEEVFIEYWGESLQVCLQFLNVLLVIISCVVLFYEESQS